MAELSAERIDEIRRAFAASTTVVYANVNFTLAEFAALCDLALDGLRVPRLAAALRSALPYMEDHNDAGPRHAGWQSEALVTKIDEAYAALQARKE